MCSDRSVTRRRAWIVGLGGLVLLCASSRVHAQDAEQFRMKVDRLAERFDTLRELVLTKGSIGVPTESIVVGPNQPLVRPERRTWFANVAAAAWDSLSVTLGVDTVLIRPSLIRPSWPDQPAHAAGDLARHLLNVMWNETDASLGSWLIWITGFDSLSNTLAEVVYVELATTPWERVKACRAGDLEACARVLDVTVTGDTVSLWYTVDEQRRAVVEHSGRWWMRMTPEHRACVDGEAGACATYLSQRRWIMGYPLSRRARDSLLRVALEIGGEGALGRLVRTHTPETGARLAAAAGIPRDSLIAVWRERILAAAPPQVIMTGRTGVTAMAWSLLLVFLALRSTRWRDR